MATATCDWRRCDEEARLALLVGAVLEAAEPRGVYCVRHAAISRRAMEQQMAETVWLDWCAPAAPRRLLVGDGMPVRRLHRHVPERPGTSQ